MSKESIRKQIQKLREESQSVISSSKTGAEAKLLIQSMLAMMEIIVAVLLERKIRKNSSNSGLPPSKDFGSNGNRNKMSGDRAGLGSNLPNLKHTMISTTTAPSECTKCGEVLATVQASRHETREKIDIFYEVVTHKVTAEIKDCPECGHVNKGAFPEGMDGNVQYGDGIRVAIINYLTVQMMSLQRCQEHLKGLIGRAISQAIMLKYLWQFSESLADWEKQQIEKLLKSSFIHCDETGARIDKKNWWVHSYSSGDTTLKFIHKNRGREAMEEIGIIPRYGGILIHDCWASYLAYKNVQHALCGAHLLRELKFIEDLNSYSWATLMKKLLQSAAEKVASRTKKRVFTKEEYQLLKKRYRAILVKGMKEMSPFPEKAGKRGRVKSTEAQNLWKRLKKHENSVLMFARKKEVEFTNNRAERDLRMSKVKQKVSGCFRTLEMARVFYRISSYLKTMRYRGYSAFEAINLALQGKIPL